MPLAVPFVHGEAVNCSIIIKYIGSGRKPRRPVLFCNGSNEIVYFTIREIR